MTSEIYIDMFKKMYFHTINEVTALDVFFNVVSLVDLIKDRQTTVSSDWSNDP